VREELGEGWVTRATGGSPAGGERVAHVLGGVEQDTVQVEDDGGGKADVPMLASAITKVNIGVDFSFSRYVS
jgi:hypothetical protein